uniref:Uncharacterized protein n=1 Tax=Anguilla anguilla TaxID=7936 RepID=A0A0E9SW54_ANGAN
MRHWFGVLRKKKRKKMLITHQVKLEFYRKPHGSVFPNLGPGEPPCQLVSAPTND